MHGGGTVEQRRAGQAVPDVLRKSESFLGGIERDEAERVIDEMRRNICEEDEAGAHPQVTTQPAHGKAREQFRAPRHSQADGTRQRHFPKPWALAVAPAGYTRSRSRVTILSGASERRVLLNSAGTPVLLLHACRHAAPRWAGRRNDVIAPRSRQQQGR